VALALYPGHLPTAFAQAADLFQELLAVWQVFDQQLLVLTSEIDLFLNFRCVKG
jgi:hypothetical protein